MVGLVCLFTRLLGAETNLGPQTQNAQDRLQKTILYKYAVLVVYGNNRQTQFKVKGKRREGPQPLTVQHIKLNNFTVSLTKRLEKLINS